MNTSPTTCLAAADALLAPAATTAAGARNRAAAFLLRMALEEALRRYWDRVCPDINRCGAHMRSLCLEFYGGAGISGPWSACWNALSRACHYHGYDLTPSAVELRARRAEAAEIVERLSVSAAG